MRDRRASATRRPRRRLAVFSARPSATKREADPEVDIAVDARGPSTCDAKSRTGAIAPLLWRKWARDQRDSTYMEKIAIGPLAVGVVDIDEPARELRGMAKAKASSRPKITLLS